jgi:Sec7-like guanine-nucleotide exchange factor
MAKKTAMPVESQQTDRVLLAFAERYYECNSNVFNNSHTTYILTVCILMLHTTCWNVNVKAITQRQFVESLRVFPDVYAMLSEEHVIVRFIGSKMK